jgi:hypothetical protein
VSVNAGPIGFVAVQWARARTVIDAGTLITIQHRDARATIPEFRLTLACSFHAPSAKPAQALALSHNILT